MRSDVPDDSWKKAYRIGGSAMIYDALAAFSTDADMAREKPELAARFVERHFTDLDLWRLYVLEDDIRATLPRDGYDRGHIEVKRMHWAILERDLERDPGKPFTPDIIESAVNLVIAEEARKRRNLPPPAEPEPPARKSSAVVRCLKDVDPEEVEWLWPQRVAIGKLNLYAGDPGTGKSQATLDLAARLSRGMGFPDGTRSPIGDTIVLTCEDDPADTIRPRLDALGADVTRVHILDGRRMPSGKLAIPSLEDVDVFRDAVLDIQAAGGTVKLLIVDPLDAYMNGRDGHKGSEVREALMPLLKLAQELRFAVLGIMHFNKSVGTSPIYRVNGGIAFVGTARIAWAFLKDPRDDARRLMLPIKKNLGRDTGMGLAYHIEEAGNQPLIVWDGQADDDVGDVMSATRPSDGRERVAPAQNDALEALKAEGGRASSKTLAAALGKSPAAMGNILRKLRESGQVKPGDRFGLWSLVTTPEEEP